ncbi:TrkA C-terminal domain protein [Gleimia coleocanis DSM 15436]|uniref:TrkA C-terminal domain protein n=2 Tax=Gleimia TaxID=2692113 RepID=C0VYA9_9ACTO|nr:TrkA C-terminal domain-containing protein [Gleimia coleocanis]EEH64412.1 TrkA C-terminal domain protein [Gleimia coleocanis DSM 15436]
MVVAVGAAIGQIKLGPLRFGAAGALFVGLFLSGMYPELGKGMGLLQSIGLALFVYTVGVSAGATFITQLRKQTNLIVAGAVVSIIGAIVTVIGAYVLDIPKNLATGLYTGSLTAAPALDAAINISKSSQAGAGYAVGYPFGVVVGIIAASIVVARPWAGENDTPSLAGTGLVALTALVENPVNMRDIELWKNQSVRISYLRRNDWTRVALPGEDLLEGDMVTVVGDEESVNTVISQLGTLSSVHLADDRRYVDFERITVSNPDVAGKTIAELNLPSKYGAMISRVRRGDLDLLAKDELALQPGDRIGIVVPSKELDVVTEYFGDSSRKVSEVDALALGLGLVLGMLLGLVTLPVPGGVSFSLGAAAGPLVMGMILGALRRTGPLVWSLPEAANLTIRQLGLLFFLSALGLGAGSDFKEIVLSSLGWKAALLATVTVLVCTVALAIAGKFMKLSAPRVAGGVAGFMGQPAILQEAIARVADERIESAYAALFTTSIVVKILLVPLIFFLL